MVTTHIEEAWTRDFLGLEETAFLSIRIRKGKMKQYVDFIRCVSCHWCDNRREVTSRMHFCKFCAHKLYNATITVKRNFHNCKPPFKLTFWQFDTFSVIGWSNESKLPVPPPGLLVVLILRMNYAIQETEMTAALSLLCFNGNSVERLILHLFSCFHEMLPHGSYSSLVPRHRHCRGTNDTWNQTMFWVFCIALGYFTLCVLLLLG